MRKSQPQAQYNLTEQLRKLISLANVNGLYDAADFVSRLLEDAEVRRRQYEGFLSEDKK